MLAFSFLLSIGCWCELLSVKLDKHNCCVVYGATDQNDKPNIYSRDAAILFVQCVRCLLWQTTRLAFITELDVDRRQIICQWINQIISSSSTGHFMITLMLLQFKLHCFDSWANYANLISLSVLSRLCENITKNVNCKFSIRTYVVWLMWCVITLIVTTVLHLVLLTFIMILGRHRQHGVLYVLIFVNFGFVELLVKVRRVVVLISNADTNEFRDCKEEKIERCN